MDSNVSYARLKSVIGRNAVTINSFALHGPSDTFLQVAGSSIIVSSSSCSDRIDGHLISSSKQVFTCVAVTSCGRYAATGEAGHNPLIRLWQLRDEHGNFCGRFIRSMAAHNISISIIKFTPDDSTLISIGCQHDAQIITWDWRTGQDLGIGKLMSPVNALTVSFDSSMCVTVGSKSVKYWFLPMASDGFNKRSGLTSRSAILADKRNVNFVDATFCDSNNRLVAVTSTGEILEFNGNKKYVKCYTWKESGDFGAICVAKISDGLLVGCTDGLIRLFCLIGDDLDFLADLAPPTHLFIDPSDVYDSKQLQSHPDDVVFAEPRCIVASSSSPVFIVGYADRSIVEFSRENKSWSFRRASLAHVGSINHIEPYPSTSPCLPAGTIITSGSDGTLRFWNFTADDDERSEASNILCPNLLKIIHISEDPSLLLDKRQFETVGPSSDESSQKITGVTFTRVSHDGRMIVAGTANGMLHFIDLSFSDTPFLDQINAHDNEVTTIDFSDHATTSKRDHPIFLATGGRDRFVHIFRRVPFSAQFVHCSVLDSHQSTIKSAQFASNNGELYLYTCASDRSMIVWRLDHDADVDGKFSRLQQITTPSSISDMIVLKYVDLIIIAGHDRNLRQYDLNAKHVRDTKGADDQIAAHGKIVKIGCDSSASFVCSVCSDKFVYVTDLRTGNCLAVLCGFGSPPTGAIFSDDFKHIFVTTSNGAIFDWRLAKNLTERMISAQVRLMEEVTMRTSTPDSLLESGSETISDSNSFCRLLGAPEFSGSSASLCSDDDSTQFSSSVRGSDRTQKNPKSWHKIGDSSYARVGDSSFSPTVQTAPAVERRTLTNIFSSPEHYETDASETQSDFISSRRTTTRLFADEDESKNSEGSGHFLETPLGADSRRSASPLIQPLPDQRRTYQSSKSMMNLRDINNSGGVRVPTAKEFMLSHIAAQRNAQSGSSSNNMSGRMRWGEMEPVKIQDWQPTSTSEHLHHVQPAMVTTIRDQYKSPYSMVVDSTTPPAPPLAPRTASRAAPPPLTTPPPSHQALQQIQSNTTSPFRRKSIERNSLSRKFLENGKSQPKTVWSPQQTMGQNGTPRRSSSNLFAAVNSESSSNLLRRPDDFSYSSNIRSRSQSPNKLALSQMIGTRDAPSSPSSTGAGSFVMSTPTRSGAGFQQKRRDSDMSYVKSTRGRDEMRKSTDALNKLMAVRNKLHQSSENLRKSTENLSLLKNFDETIGSQRTRSISNLRNESNLENFSTFEADDRLKFGSTSSLAQSRMLARSIGNLNSSAAMEGSMMNRDYESPGKRLANTIQMMRKASNSDLTAPEQFDDNTIQSTNRMRGAVQKKMDRYRQRNKNSGFGGRNQTSEESDSNTSDMIPLNINKRALAAGSNRSTTTSDCSPTSSTRSSSLTMNGIGIGSALTSTRRSHDQQRTIPMVATPRRSGGNYLVTKMNKSIEGPDLGSDESPRSSVNSNEWQTLIETSQDGSRNPLICHVQDCMDQLRIHVDKSIQARKLVEDDSNLSIEQKKIVMCEIERSIERILEKLSPNKNGNPNSLASGNDYSPMKSTNIYGILKENLTSRQ